MDKMWMFYSSVILLSVIQIQHVLATKCNIVSVTSPSASTLNVEWSSYAGTSVYLLNFRVVNSTNIAPVVVMQSAPSTQRLIQGLRPGHVYEVTLKVFQFYTVLCTDVKTAMTVPATSQITFSKAISSTSIRFEWSSAIGADSYILFVEKLFSSPPQKYNQTFTNLSGRVDGLTPSTVYNCYIYSSNSAGRGAKSNTKTIIMLVQPPTGVTLESTGKSTARVTWNAVSKVLFYQVTVSDDNPSNAPVIRNTSTTSMDISNLEPCSTYTVGVSSVNVFLVPGEASNVTYKTATTNPVTTISSDYSCSSGMVTVTWDLVFGANLYRATAVDSTGASLNCTSASTSCQITMLKCGEKYQVHVTAISDNCESTSNTSTLFETVPCAPGNPVTIHDCSSNVIVFSWQPTNNTFYYVAMAVDNTGKATECRTPDNTCYFTNAGCGQFYKYTVYAVSSECNSEVSQPEFVWTSPCLPTNVQTAAECHSDMLITTWDSAAGALSYTVEAQGNTGETYNCTSSSNSCAVTGVPCGEHLSLWIVASNDNCSTDKVLGEVAQTVPCTPINVSASVDCSQDSARVDWTMSIGAVFYVAIAQDANGNSYSCNSMSTNCLIEGLRCGQNYTGSVISTNLMCNSSASEEVTFMTAPCPPTNIEAFRDCDANRALIVWQNHQPTGLYTATIEDQSGAQLTCTSNTVNNCKITSLPCGKRYNVTVINNDGNCPSTSTPISMDSVPCSPEDVWASVACASGELTVAWNISVPAENYTTTIYRGMSHPLRCNSTDTKCTMGGLLCGSSYRVIVRSVIGTCVSLPSTEVTVQTLPCPPTNITAMHRCAPDPVPVSWVASESAKYYTAVAVSGGGHKSECTTNKTSCSLPGLHCGEVYTISVSGADDNCTGQLSDTVSLNTEPCSPSNVSSHLMCSTGTAQVSWAPSANAVTYAVKATSNGQTLNCSSPSPNCTLSNLVCGQAYDIRVAATDGTCVSNFSAPFRQDQVPCTPENVSAILVCFNHSALVTWVGSPSAIGYNVTAMGQDGHTHHCQTNTTSCQLPDIHCGETYGITVTPYSKTCAGNPSAVYSFRAGLCAPSNVTVSPACEDSTVSWSHITGAEMFIATATADDGHTHTCSSNSSSSCNFTDLHCEETYAVTVVTVDRGCWSLPSSAVELRTALCPPTNLTGQVSCDTNMLTLTWDQSTVSGATYTLQTERAGGTLPPSVQPTSNTSQTLTNLSVLCGQRYAFRIAAQDGNCRSSYSPPIEISTAPCQPTNLTAHVDCGTNKGNFSWAESSGAGFYTVEVTGEHGHVASCSSNDTSCAVKLHCGQSYSATLVASTESCNSSKHADIHFDSEPCQPVIVSAQALCQSEEVQISWQQASGVVNYLVTATGSLGYVESRNTTQTFLSAALPCGQNYNVTVQGQGSECDSLPSSPAFFKTTPCIPRDVTTYVQCEFNVGSVSWGPSDGAETYVAVATGLDGHTHQFLTNNTSCTWNDLHCGEVYTVVVRAKADNCTSLPSNSSVIHMDPCAPQNLAASVNCDMKVVSLSWNASNGTELYMVSAEAGNKSVGLTTNVTTAHFSDFTCGQNYSLTVTPHNQHCPGSSSAPASIQTWPCPPAGVSTMQDCLTGIVMVTWQARNGSDYYTATMQTDTGISKMCMSDSNECSVPGLTCGHNFSVSVTASNQQCNITSSQTTSLQSVPCVPTNVSVVMDCANNTAVVSWSASRGAVQYSVTAHSSHSNISCMTSGLHCSLDNLTCGNHYTVQVVAMDDNCSSIPSQALMFNSAPCPPQNVSAEVHCSSNDMTITWDAIREADHFLVSVIAENGGTSESCNTTNTACSISNVTCGNTFRVQVTSVRGACRGRHSQTHSILSAPCQPQRIRGNLDCVTNSAWISWDAAPGADSYSVSAVGGEDHTANCTTSSNTTCEVEHLACGILYNFSVIAESSKCDSQPSATIDLQTAPCSLSSITAVPQCHNSSILVMWDLMKGSKGNTVYIATAEARDRTYLSCNSTGTSCYLHGAQCDLHYTIIVATSSDQCSSMRSPPYRISMEPCPPRNLVVNASCEDHSVLVSWSPSPVAETYHVVAMGVDGHVHTCNTTSSNCSISELHCDQQYTVFLTASHENCSSKANENSTLNTGPCKPDGLSVTFHCINQSALLSWKPRNNTVDYYGCAQAGNGSMLYCHSTNPTCTIQGLDCGTVYNFSVQASDGACNSSFSDPVQSGAAPCPPDTVEVQLIPMQLEIQVMHFSWTQVTCSDTEYMLKLTGSLLGDSQAQFELSSCWTSMTYFEIPLPCGSSYNATVESRNAAGTSNPSVPLNGTTAPCPPSGVVYSGNSSFAKVSWNASVFAATYTVYDNSVTPKAQLCSTAGLSCSLSNIAFTNLVITASNAAGESEETILIVTQGRRRRDLSEQMPEIGVLSAPVLDVKQPTPTVVFVEWSRVDAASHYSLVIRKQGSSSEPQELSVYGESIFLTDLSPDSTYCFSVSARTASGPQSEPVCVQTGQGLPQ
ncbi:uncharacterized protein LOC122886733 [Siniperca chuatsi]|uniref:uncharacterized protein LOC122886733 n=1 Tax=Siniperca chuatsi TaxID=119488 RepID=UPI001CE18B82|nr:uncharacterized protein LOC122886733 [Siniperca chuatsi]